VEQVSAGTVGVYGGLWDAELRPNESLAVKPEDLFIAGEPLLFVATGERVPAFFAVVEAPPGLEDFICTSADGELRFAWNGSGAGEVMFVLSERDNLLDFGDDDHRNLRCHFDVSAGEATVPADALAFMQGQGGVEASISVVSHRTLQFSEGWNVELSATDLTLACP
jgi:hypothetical protein